MRLKNEGYKKFSLCKKSVFWSEKKITEITKKGPQNSCLQKNPIEFFQKFTKTTNNNLVHRLLQKYFFVSN